MENILFKVLAKDGLNTDSLEVINIYRHSRNTVILEFEHLGVSYVAKFNHSKSENEVDEEFEQLTYLYDQFDDDNVSVIKPYLVNQSHKLIISQKASGQMLTDLINQELKGQTHKKVDKFINLSSKGLYLYHSLTSDGFADDCKLYLDYGPANIIADHKNIKITLLDPPELKEWGHRFNDVGTFLFELSRTSIRAGKLTRYQSEKVDVMKARFINQYLSLCGKKVNEEIIDQIKQYELKRINRIIGFYNLHKSIYERFRGMIFSSIIRYYQFYLLPKSYQNIKLYLLNR